MLKIYAGQWLLHDDRLQDLRVLSPKLTLEVNKTGSLEFSIYPDHPYYTKIAKFKTIITVYQDDLLLFRGRVLNEEKGFYNEKQVACEGQLAFLLDSIQRPYDFTGSVKDYFIQLVTNHNEQVEAVKQFAVGNVTVTDPNDYIVRSNIDYVDTWEEINKKLLDLLGGFLQVRYENKVAYLDYLQDFSTLSTQTVEFGKNLLDLKNISKGEDIATALIPLGAKLKDEEGQDTDKRLTVAAVNDGNDFITDKEAVDKYGFICRQQVWDDVTEASNLLAKGKAYLAGIVNVASSVEITAADLAGIELNVQTFRLGSYVQVTSKPHGIDQLFMVQKLSVDLLEPAANRLTLGGMFQGFSESIHGLSDRQHELVRTIENVAKNASQAVYNVERNLEASIDIAADNIQQSVSEKYYLKEDTDRLVSEVSSQLEQTAEGFEMQFTRFNADLEDVVNGTEAEFELIRKYIRFVDGSILLGELGNELELKISNDRISFLQDNVEVAYFSDNKLYVTDGHFINSLQIGEFAFIPRANGNLSFKKLDSASGESIVGEAAAGAAVVV